MNRDQKGPARLSRAAPSGVSSQWDMPPIIVEELRAVLQLVEEWVEARLFSLLPQGPIRCEGPALLPGMPPPQALPRLPGLPPPSAPPPLPGPRPSPPPPLRGDPKPAPPPPAGGGRVMGPRQCRFGGLTELEERPW